MMHLLNMLNPTFTVYDLMIVLDKESIVLQRWQFNNLYAALKEVSPA